ncbi:MAG: hypothetical protein ACOYL5_04980 [Phototrophicaceae bacterium]|jgi:hypothetical protein
MPFTFDWLDDTHTTILIYYPSAFTVEEFLSVTQQINEQIKSVGNPVDLIIDQHDLKQLPPGVISLLRTQARRSAARHIVIIGMQPLAQGIARVLSVLGIAEKMPHYANSVAEAQTVLVELRQQIKTD